MSPFIAQLARNLLFCFICVGCLWFVTRRREAWLRFVERDLSPQQRIHIPERFIHLQRRFCIGRGVVVFLRILVLLSVLLMLFGIWLDIQSARNRPNKSLQPTRGGAFGLSRSRGLFYIAVPAWLSFSR